MAEDTTPYLSELENLTPKNPLHRRWMQYARSLPREHFLMLIRNGLTHQARAIRSMVREVISGGTMPPSLEKKLELLVAQAENEANKIRS